MQSKIFTIRFTPEQFSKLSGEANEYGMNLSELVRYRLGFESKINTRKIIFLLNKTSNNINQIAKGINIANLNNRIDNSVSVQVSVKLTGVFNEFKKIYDLMKSIKNAN